MKQALIITNQGSWKLWIDIIYVFDTWYHSFAIKWKKKFSQLRKHRDERAWINKESRKIHHVTASRAISGKLLGFLAEFYCQMPWEIK